MNHSTNRRYVILFSMLCSLSAFSSETIHYTYDITNQIIKAVYHDGSSVNYVYDNMGNRLIKSAHSPTAPSTNQPPGNVTLTPAYGLNNVDTQPVLSWTPSIDPDGDSVVYYVYLSTSNTQSTLISSGTQTQFQPTEYCLEPATIYYWSIVIRDNHQAETQSILTNFTTQSSHSPYDGTCHSLTDFDGDTIDNMTDADDDNDGLPDSWEITYNLNQFNATDAQQDADNDGVSNLQEYQRGSDPQDDQSTPLSIINTVLDITGLSWVLAGNSVWKPQSTVVIVGNKALQSGEVDNNQLSSIKTIVSHSKSVSFYWKVSSEPTYDFLRFYIDNAEVDMISGEVEWEQKTFALDPSSQHTLEWVYSKDSSNSYGQDVGWLDGVSIRSNDTIIPIILLLLQE